MKKSIRSLSVLSLALIGAVSLQACGKSRARVSTLRGMDGASQATVIPSGKSAAAISPWLIGTFYYQRSACRAPDGGSIPIMLDGDMPAEAVQISDRQLIDTTEYSNGCVVVKTFAILGIDKSTMALGSRQVQITLNGEADTQGECSGYVTQQPADRTWSYSYELNGGDLSFLSAPTEPCEADERNEEVFLRQ